MPPQPNLTSFIGDTLYEAKMSYGRPIWIRRVVSQTVGSDLVTTDVIEQISIFKAVVLDSSISREFIQRLVSIVANRDFTYGGYFDRDEKKFMVFRPDLYQRATKTYFDIRDTDSIIYKDRRWEILKIVRFEDDQGFVITGQEVKGNSPESHPSLDGKNRLVFSQTAEQS